MFRRILSLPLIFILLLCLSGPGGTACAEILHENGSLRGFLGGSCPGCAYDNWISHISEGVARPDYNDYGPQELDPQMNGFGQYVQISDTGQGDSLIADWYQLFASLLQSDTMRADSIFLAAQLDSVYDFAVLQDSTRTYYILREHLNLAYYDEQATPDDSTDDVRGSFDYGWGVYIFSPQAAHPEIIIEAPHPEDDFITPWIATDVFEFWDAGLLMIAGAGREVLWTEEGTYDNTKSLSDPSRISQSVFHAAHRAFVDRHPDNFALQLHSYDSDAHPNHKSLVISAGADDGFPNDPLLDRCAYQDMISLTPYVAVPANLCGDHPDVTVGSYYSMFYEGGYLYQGDSPQISGNVDLTGYGQNRQMLYSHIGHDDYLSSENFVHIEMDELPDALLDSAPVFYRTDLPGGVTFANYENALNYYHPAWIALQLAREQTPMSELIAPVPAILNIGNVAVHDTETRSVSFQNISQSETLLVTGARVNLPVFELSDIPLGALLSPGESCSLSVSFTPSSAITYYGVLTLQTDHGCGTSQVRGTGSGAAILLTPSSLGFDTNQVGVPDTLPVTCRNTGNSTLRLNEFVSSTPGARILPAPDSTIGHNNNVTLRIEFTPLDVGSAICSVGVVSNAYNADTAWIDVSGAGIATPASVSGLTIRRSGSHMELRWPRVNVTTQEFPLAADGYLISARPGLAAPDSVIAVTPDTLFLDIDSVLDLDRRFYSVRAFYEAAPDSAANSPPSRE